MGDSVAHDKLIFYLEAVLIHLYRYEKWLVAGNLNHYHDDIDNTQHLIVPDVAVFKGIEIPLEEQQQLTSWNMRHGKRAAPPVVIEVSSEGTYPGDIDLNKKPRSYGLVGVKEYFAYDPHEPPVYPKTVGKRLLGWRYDEDKQPVALEADERGWLWSEVLESWLAEDGLYLRLYDRDGNRRLTGQEAAWARLRELGIDPEKL
jgi:Uma2 family endonuclease